MKAKRKTKGISLIVLVLTVIVLSILASAVIVSLNNTNILSEASKSVLKSNIQTMQDMATVYLAENYHAINMEKEYLITEFGITNEKFKEYETIAVIKAGRIYIKPNAPENVQEVAKELNILIDGVSTDSGNVTLDKTATALKIYGSEEGVGDKSKNILQISHLYNFTETNGVYTSTANDTATTLKMKAQFKVGDSYVTSIVDCPQNNTRYSITITVPTEEWTSFRLANSGKIIESSIMIDLPYEKYKGKDITVSFKVLNNTPATFAISDIQIEEGSTATEYIPYGYYNIPVTMTGKNLFDKDSAMLFGGYLSSGKLNSYNSKIDITATFAIKCKPNTQYTVTRQIIGNRFSVGTSPNKPNEDVTMTNLKEDYTASSITITSGENDACLYVWFYNSNYDTKYTYKQLMNEIQVEYGSTATEYEPYNGKTYNIYISEPLRKVGNVADYVDCVSKEVVRCVGVNSTTGALEVLSTPKRESITMDNMNFTGIKHIFVNTLVTPSNIEVKY